MGFKQEIGSTWIKLSCAPKLQCIGHSQYEITLMDERGSGTVTLNNTRSKLNPITGLMPESSFKLIMTSVNRVGDVVSRSKYSETARFHTTKLGKKI